LRARIAGTRGVGRRSWGVACGALALVLLDTLVAAWALHAQFGRLPAAKPAGTKLDWDGAEAVNSVIGGDATSRSPLIGLGVVHMNKTRDTNDAH
jgi:hypothetical protein